MVVVVGILVDLVGVDGCLVVVVDVCLVVVVDVCLVDVVSTSIIGAVGIVLVNSRSLWVPRVVVDDPGYAVPTCSFSIRGGNVVHRSRRGLG